MQIQIQNQNNIISFSTVKFCQWRQSLKCLVSRVKYLFNGKL